MRNQGPNATARSIPSTLAAVRRGLSTLKDQWNEDSEPITFEKNKPGIKLIKIGSTFEKTSSTQSNDQPRVDSDAHPWLNDVPSDLSRLVSLGKVRLEVDEAAVQAAKRNALTAFQFKFAYRMRYRSPVPNPSGLDGEKIKLQVRFTEFDWDVEHRIMLSDKFHPTKPWETPLLRHEFDHIAVSTDPRLLAMMESLNRAEVVIATALDQGQEHSSKRFDDEVHAYVKRFQKSIEELVNDRYRKLDEASNNGLQAVADRSTFFRKLYSPQELENEKYEYLGLVLPAVKKVTAAQINRHYGLR